MAKIITIGNALVDIMTLLESDETLDSLNLPKGSMQLVDFETSRNVLKYTDNLTKSLACGGSAANTARSLAELGAITAYIGKVGNDEIGKFFAKDTIDAGVIPLLLESETPTGTAIALVSKDSERTFATYLGAAAELSPDDTNEKLFDGYDILHIEGYLIFNNALIEKVVRTAKACGLKVSIDLASYNVVEANLDFLKYLIKEYIDIVFANEEEAKAFTGKNPCEALLEISNICDIAVVKVGEQGSMLQNGDFIVEASPIKVKPIDTTGAGDNYAAGFLYGYINGWSFEKCTKAGSILAGNVIEVIGTKMDDKRWANIKEMISSL
jgi:sugar/nucleoside kinase (ribokinase family)